MNAEQHFLEQLDQSLGPFPNKQEIISEYEIHLYEIFNEIEIQDETEAYETIEKRLGTPKEIAKMWMQEVRITPKKTQWIFVTFNLCLFVGGGLLTVGYNLFDWNWIDFTWRQLTAIPSIIIMLYLVFWGLLGYEIGKEFGHRGRKLLRNTFLICIAPNVLLANVTVFQLIPSQWFQPLLSVPFILVCIGFTALLYPISWMGYQWGKKASV
ncbi:HAAS signaling domain-containing protein [Aquibacillus rhizosphaerae]|uniref:DUF1700 domain-containing protein n=1 Tax=Aquibacillus rhizosphaerae TaxID=3051431 RepID=A0ABT7LAH3_9BACI|nr:hypothetical protein [Aquibacillus sp. LR5S19]MDL4842863.1 hypothetical protein [Aquibacillus sp. LR5S19]